MIPILIAVACLMAVLMLSLVTKDHAMLILHIINTGVLTMIFMLWMEINYGDMIASDVPGCVMWASTISVALTMVRTLKGAGYSDV